LLGEYTHAIAPVRALAAETSNLEFRASAGIHPVAKANQACSGGRIYRKGSPKRMSCFHRMRFAPASSLAPLAWQDRGQSRPRNPIFLMGAGGVKRHVRVWHDPPARRSPWRRQAAQTALARPAGVLACQPGRRFRGPYRQSEMSQAAAYYL
jgi:hypothetical protein